MIVKSLFVIILCVLSLCHSESLLAQTKCNKESVLKQYQDITRSIEEKILSADAILVGDIVENVNVKQLLGTNFKFEETDTELTKLNDAISDETYLPDEYIPLRDCLIGLKQKKRIEELYSIVNLLNNKKIQLLSKNKELKNILSDGAESRSAIPAIKSQVDNELKESTKLKEKLQEKLIQSEVEISKTKNLIEKDLILYRSNLEKIKLEIVNLNLKYTESLESHLQKFDEENIELLKISSQLKDKDLSTLTTQYERVGEIWIKVVNKAFSQITNDKVFFQFPDIPEIPNFPDEIDPLLKKQINSTYDELKTLKMTVVKNISEMKNKEIEVQSTLLLQVNLLRSELFQRMPLNYFVNEVFSSRFWLLLKTEVLSSPYRVLSFFFGKYLYLKEQIGKGVEGYKTLSINFLFMSMFVLIIFFFKYTINISYRYLNDFLTKLLFKYKNIKIIKYTSSAWYRIRDNYHEFVWVIIITYGKNLESFSSYTLLLDFAIIILFYKILRSLVVISLGIISSVDSLGFSKFKIKANDTSKMVGKIYLFYFISMLFLEGVLGKTYVYSFINLITLFYCAHILFKISKDWEREIEKYLERNVSGILVGRTQQFSTHIPKGMVPSFYLLVLFIVSIVNFFIYLTEDFGISKRISANIFKKQIENFESSDEVSTTLPSDYLERFSLKSLDREEDFVEPDNSILLNCINEINEWCTHISDEHSLVIYGDKGIGKTTLVKKIKSEIDNNPEVRSIYAKIPSKLDSKEKLIPFLVNLLDLPEDVTSFDPSFIDTKLDKPVVIFLDETQNIFISESGGFDAYYGLINIVNLDIKNIFWVLTFNKYSWLYLDRAFGKNQFFRNVFQYKGWSDQKIKELIQLRHKNTNYKLSYDVLITATKSEDEADKYTSIENKFFKLLWELSNGNPRAAVYLWTQSLKRKNSSTFMVYVPRMLNGVDFHDLSDDTLFVLAHVLKHENLSLKEITRTTNLPTGLCRNSIKVCLEKELLFKDERNRYMVDLKHQYSVIKHLKSKNFIYGN